MTCEELAPLLPDLIDGTLEPEVQAQAEEALTRCPQCRQELENAREILALLVDFRSQYASVQLEAGFETRLLSRLRRQTHGLALLDLSSRTFSLWLLELINLLGSLLDPKSKAVVTGSPSTQTGLS